MRYRTPRRANTAIIVALGISVLGAFSAVAVDLGWLNVNGYELQTSVDAAVLAGGINLGAPTDVRNAAVALAAANPAGGQPVEIDTLDVEIGWWDHDERTFEVLAAEDEGWGNAVRTSHTLPEVGLFLAAFVGTRSASVTRAAVAGYTDDSLCAVLTDTSFRSNGDLETDSYNSTVAPYSAPGNDRGSVCSNGDIDYIGTGHIDGDSVTGPDGTQNIGSNTAVTGSVETAREPFPMPTVDTSDARSFNDNNLLPSSVMQGPMRFQALSTQTVHFPSGTYYFTSFMAAADVVLTFGDDVEIYLDGMMHFMGSYDINVDGDPGDVMIYQGSSARMQFDGGGVMNAGIIAPDSMVQFNGDDEVHGIVIADQMLLNGGDMIHVDEDLARRLNLRPPGPIGLLD